MLSQCGVRKRSDILSRLAQGISLSLGKQNRRLAEHSPPAQFVHSLNLFQTSGLWDVHLDTGQGQLGKKGAPKKKETTHPTQNCDRRENLLSGKNSAVLYTSGTRDTLYDRLNGVFWIKARHVT